MDFSLSKGAKVPHYRMATPNKRKRIVAAADASVSHTVIESPTTSLLTDVPIFCQELDFMRDVEYQAQNLSASIICLDQHNDKWRLLKSENLKLKQEVSNMKKEKNLHTTRHKLNKLETNALPNQNKNLKTTVATYVHRTMKSELFILFS